MDKILVNKQNSIKLIGSKILYFDPYEVEALHDADYIFITHPHWDHFSLLSILEIKKQNTFFVVIKDLVEELLSIGVREDDILVVKPNSKYVLKNLEIKTIPSYNLHKKYHKKEMGYVSYIVDFDGVTYYVAGDTDNTKEARSVICDVAFLPIGGTYTMDCLEASNLANVIKPKLVIPTHYGMACGSSKDASVFKKRLDKDITCKLLIKDGDE